MYDITKNRGLDVRTKNKTFTLCEVGESWCWPNSISPGSTGSTTEIKTLLPYLGRGWDLDGNIIRMLNPGVGLDNDVVYPFCKAANCLPDYLAVVGLTDHGTDHTNRVWYVTKICGIIDALTLLIELSRRPEQMANFVAEQISFERGEP